jgi:hypothetical protein
MTKEQLAEMLNGRQYGDEINMDEARQARADGLVVVYGASDDLMEFEGAITDEFGCYDGGTAYLVGGKLLGEHDEDCECKFCGFAEELEKAKSIKAIWDTKPFSWTYETDIPHATFDIWEDDQEYCRGIVFRLEDAK